MNKRLVVSALVSGLLLAGLIVAVQAGPSLLPSARTGARAGGAALPAAPAGGFVAAHFAGRPGGADLRAQARAIAERGPELAGVRHVIILAASESDARGAAAGWGEGAPAVIADPDGSLAATIARTPLPADGSNTGFPLTVLIDESGRPVQTLRAGDGEWVAMESLSAQVTMRIRQARTDLFHLDGGVAADGYDVVSYREGGGPKPGSPTLRSTWQGITYQFANAANRRRFAENPAAFEPAFGGWSAGAMAEGERAAPTPSSFVLVENRLCLFQANVAPDILERWRANGRAEFQRADGQWRRMGGN